MMKESKIYWSPSVFLHHYLSCCVMLMAFLSIASSWPRMPHGMKLHDDLAFHSRRKGNTVALEDRTRTSGMTVQGSRFRLDMRKHFLTVRAVQHWNSLAHTVVGFPPLSTGLSGMM